MGISCPVLPGSEPNSVAIHGNLMAVAVANAVRTDNGHAVFFDLRGLTRPGSSPRVEVGALPDMITFTEDGKYVLTANEGEPNPGYTIDPPGTVSIIEVEQDRQPAARVRHVGFDRVRRARRARQALKPRASGSSDPAPAVAQDLEPEYIAVRGNKAYVTLQENNALAIINIAGGTVEKIVGAGAEGSRAGRQRPRRQRPGQRHQHPQLAGPRDVSARRDPRRSSRRGAPI